MSGHRKWMLAVLGIGILMYGVWTAFLVFIALMAESGGKNSNPALGLALLWPMGELIWTWFWILRHADRYSRSSRQGLGNALLVFALIAPVPFALAINGTGWEWEILLSIAVTVTGCWGARFAWSRNEQSKLTDARQ
ncbi:MAG TPA: hypothetical protein VKH81_01795 [Candidatus Angelobacter sp.]|nr:hypothetical protein [Candidatus Angelobacter sp.]